MRVQVPNDFNEEERHAFDALTWAELMREANPFVRFDCDALP